MTALYQKYRPQKFSEIFGQNNIKTTLQNEIINNKVSHAYLFCGPRAVGKTTLARVLAKAVNCQKKKEKEYEPCNECDSCLSITNFSNLDVIEVDAASNTGVDNVRDNIISLSRVKSSNNKFKVFIIDEVHMLSLSAFNALLKTLEEPPANVIFILCTTEAYKLPLTIVSRCERFDFKRISVGDMVLKLEKITKNEKLDIDNEVLELVARKSDGHLRDAESLLSQIISISGKKIDLSSAKLIIPHNEMDENISFLESLSKKDTLSAVKTINELVYNGINLKNFSNDLVELLRKMILGKVNNSLPSNLGLDLGEKAESQINNLNKNFSLDDLISITEEIILASKNIPESLIPQMPLELAIINICKGKKIDFNDIEEKTNALKENSNNNASYKKDVLSEDKEVGGGDDVAKPSSVVEKNICEDNEKLWPEFLKKLRSKNHSLSFVMQSCSIDHFDDKKVCLSFQYKFHKERIETPEIKKIVEETLEEVYKKNLKIETLLGKNDKTIKNKKGNNKNIVNDLLKTFGGQVIN
jgi:DNA polymerase III subunit gamma/tau